MLRNTSIQLLRLLTETEIRRLGKFLHSPYFNHSQPVVTLYELLRKWHPAYEEKRIRPKIFWKKLYPGEPFIEQKYWKLNFRLRCLIERFMIVEEVERDEFEARRQLTRSHGRRNAHSLLEKETKTLVGQMEAQPHQDIHSYSKSLWLKHDYFFNPQTDKYGKALFSVEDAMADLDRFYCLAKLRFASEIKNRERIFSKKIPVQLLEECVEKSSQYVTDNPAFLMYRNVLDLYDPKKAGAAFQSGKELLEHHFPRLGKHDQNEVLLNLRNYAVRELNKGKSEYWGELLELYQLGLKMDLIVDNGRIGEVAFSNIVKVGCVAEEFGWTENFIKEYEQYLNEEIREDTKILSYGILHFHKKEFEKTIEVLGQHNYNQVLHLMNAKTTLLKSWFELFLKNKDLFDLLLSKLEADEKYFRRNNKVSDQKKIEYLNFVLALRQLTDSIVKNKRTEKVKNTMRRYLREEKHIGSKSWLFEKTEEL